VTSRTTQADLFQKHNGEIHATTVSRRLREACTNAASVLRLALSTPGHEAHLYRFLYQERHGVGTLFALHRPISPPVDGEVFVGRAFQIIEPAKVPALIFGIMTRPENETLDQIENSTRVNYPARNPFSWLPYHQDEIRRAINEILWSGRMEKRLFITGADEDTRLLAATTILADLRPNHLATSMGLSTIGHKNGDPLTAFAVICCETLPSDAKGHVVLRLLSKANSSWLNALPAGAPRLRPPPQRLVRQGRTPAPMPSVDRKSEPVEDGHAERLERLGRPPATMPPAAALEALVPTASRVQARSMLEDALELMKHKGSPASLIQSIQRYLGSLDQSEGRRWISILLEEGDKSPEALALVLGGSQAAFDGLVEPGSALAADIWTAFSQWPETAQLIYITRLLRARRSEPLEQELHIALTALIDGCKRTSDADRVPREMRIGFLQTVSASDRLSREHRERALVLFDDFLVRGNDSIRPSVLIRVLGRCVARAGEGSRVQQAAMALDASGVGSGLSETALVSVAALALFRETRTPFEDAHRLAYDVVRSSRGRSSNPELDGVVYTATASESISLARRALVSRGLPTTRPLPGSAAATVNVLQKSEMEARPSGGQKADAPVRMSFTDKDAAADKGVTDESAHSDATEAESVNSSSGRRDIDFGAETPSETPLPRVDPNTEPGAESEPPGRLSKLVDRLLGHGRNR
jgi:hypothetical protein